MSLSKFITRKYIVLVAISLILLCAIFLILFPFLHAVFAAEDIAPNFFAMFTSDGLKENLGLNGPYYEIMTQWTNPILQALSTLAVIWVTATTIYSIVKEFSYGENSVLNGGSAMSIWLKTLIKLTIFAFLLTSAVPILNSIDQVGNWIIDQIATPNYDEAILALTSIDVTLGDYVKMGLGTVAAASMMTLVLIYVKVISYSILIEIGLRRIFTPFAAANIMLEGFNGSGVRYYKKYLALYIRMALIAGTMLMGGMLCVFEAGLDPLVMLAILCSCTSFIGKSATLAEELVNASKPGE